MPFEVIFLTPFIVGIAWVAYQFIRHHQETKEWVAHCPFHLRQENGILYVVPNAKVSKT